MKKIKLVFLLSVLVSVFYSCEYQEIAYEDEVEQQVYLPAATYGTYMVADSVKSYSVPTQGKQKRYSLTSDKMIIPLSVYRSGLNAAGAISVHIATDNDTLSQMASQGLMGQMEVLPAAHLAMPAQLTIENGKDIAQFELQVDRRFLLANPGKQYVTAVTIQRADRKISPKLKTAVIVIDTHLANP